MRDLGLSRLSEDRTYLIARDAASGEEFRIRADHRAKSLIDALSPTDKTVRGQLEIKMESSLSPRDIQTRIRRGESPDTVADAAGVDVDRIMAYAIPVLAEREYMVEQARKTVIRRKYVGGAGVLLGTLVNERLLARGGSPEAAAWDSWRREDGRWALHITPEGASEAASFIFDVRGRYVLPADELAHDLVGDVVVADAGDMAIADAVRSQIADGPVEPDDEHPEGVSSLKAARDRRAMGQLALGEEDGEVTAPRLDDEAGDISDEQAEAALAEAYEEDEIDQDVAVPDVAGPSSQQRKKRHERRRVPSWDEIMFGGKPEGQ
ncbi:MAG: septation protein SepH [Actinomycetota bacterium]|nr:septation protein SepH [Actinomycetota bacterium]